MARAFLRFLTAEQGGRRKPFQGTKYVTVGRFPHTKDDWSIVVEFAAPPEIGDLVAAQVRPLSSEAPANLFSRGTSFVLMEGDRQTADCFVFQTDCIVPQADAPADYDNIDGATHPVRLSHQAQVAA